MNRLLLLLGTLFILSALPIQAEPVPSESVPTEPIRVEPAQAARISISPTELIRPRTLPMLWNQFFADDTDNVRPGVVNEYKVAVQPGQTLYINVIALDVGRRNLVYIHVPEAATDTTARPRTYRWSGNVPGKTELTLQVWSEWDSPYVLEVTRK
ncbi:hypothetical protein [Candidatus Cyanaurora vandensis]|uniref:hypothetical protein n=1 Tax=Candidatus Cyanaurora vandensis TaxID=2714958 RepID=UPI00257BF914|nr:hypothetical protein [Candidatus Cyanaurora vandensis]